MKRFLVVLCLFFVVDAAAQSYPSKPMHMVVGYPPGTGMDIMGRFFADRIREATGQPVIIDNRPGAAGNIGADSVARADPDGYTFYFTTSSPYAVNIHLFRQLSFDPIKDFAPVTTIARQGFVLVVNPDMPVNNVAELTALLKSRPGKLFYGSGNSSGQIAGQMYKNVAGFDATHVPYKAVPQAILELLGGQIHFIFADATVGMAQVRGGKVRALAVTTDTRWSFAPTIPTMAEAGLPDFELSGWLGVFLPARAPKEITYRLAALFNDVIRKDGTRDYLANSAGAEAFPGTPESLAKLLASDTEKWGRVIKDAGLYKQN